MIIRDMLLRKFELYPFCYALREALKWMNVLQGSAEIGSGIMSDRLRLVILNE